jgi:hypothetical protein
VRSNSLYVNNYRSRVSQTGGSRTVGGTLISGTARVSGNGTYNLSGSALGYTIGPAHYHLTGGQLRVKNQAQYPQGNALRTRPIT